MEFSKKFATHEKKIFATIATPEKKLFVTQEKKLFGTQEAVAIELFLSLSLFVHFYTTEFYLLCEKCLVLKRQIKEENTVS